MKLIRITVKFEPHEMLDDPTVDQYLSFLMILRLRTGFLRMVYGYNSEPLRNSPKLINEMSEF